MSVCKLVVLLQLEDVVDPKGTCLGEVVIPNGRTCSCQPGFACNPSSTASWGAGLLCSCEGSWTGRTAVLHCMRLVCPQGCIWCPGP